MDREEQSRSVYEQMQESLEQAICWLERPSAEGPDADDAQRSGLFSLGVAGGLAFSGLLPGINSAALFDDISDAAEQGVGCGKGRKDTLSVEGPLFVVPQSFLHRPWVVAGVPDKHFFVVACCDASSRPVFSRQRFTKIHKISFYDKLHLRQRFRDCKDITP